MFKMFTKVPRQSIQLMALLFAFFCSTEFIHAASSDDVSLKTILVPSSGSCGSAAMQVKVVIGNPGTNSQSSVPLVLVLSGSGSATLNDTLKASLSSGGTDTFTFSSTINTAGGGTYSIKAYTNLSGDGDRTNDTSTLSVTYLSAPSAPSTIGASRCGVGSVTLKASSPSSSGIWNLFYANSTGGTILAAADSFVTPSLSSTTTYYAAAVNLKSDTVGKASTSPGASAVVTVNTYGVNFDALTSIRIDSMTIYPTSSGSVVIYINDSASGKTVAKDSQTVTVTTANNPIRIGFKNLKLNPGKYHMVPTNSTVGGFLRNSSGIAYPYMIPGVVSVTGQYGYYAAARYYYFYHWKVSYPGGCSSSLTPVTATISPSGLTPKFGTSGYCTGSATTFTDSSTAGSGLSIASWSYDFGDGSAKYSSTSTGNTTHTYAKAGSYTITETIVSNKGCPDVITKTITIYASPVASFSATTACAGSPIYVTNTSASTGITSYYYDFGDTTNASPSKGDTSHTYTYGGSHIIKYTLTVGGGCTNTATKTITVGAAISAPTGTGATKCGFGSMTLKASKAGSGQMNLWYGAAYSGSTIAYGDSFVTPSLGSTTTYYVATANMTSDTVGLANKSVSAGANSALDAGLRFRVFAPISIDSVTVYPSTSGSVIINIFDSATAKLVARDSQAVTVAVANAAKRIALNIKLNPGSYYMRPTGSTTGGFFRTTAVTYPFTIPGAVSITNEFNGVATRYYLAYHWKVSWPGGCVSNRTAVTATVTSSGATASFSTSGNCTGTAVTITDASTPPSAGSVSKWTYDFGDGSALYSSTSSGSTTHTYTTAGTYKIIQTISSGTGCQDTSSQTVVIKTLPSASFSASSACAGSPNSVKNTGSSGAGISYSYDFGDTTTASPSKGDTTHTYTYSGTHIITLTTSSTNGCSATATQTVSVISTSTLPTVSGASRCGVGSMTLKAKASSGLVNLFYDSATNGTILARGDSFVTPTLSKTTVYYVASATINYSKVGRTTKGTGTAQAPSTNGLLFHTFSSFNIDSVTAYPTSSGNIEINIVDSSTGTTVYTTKVAVTVPTTLAGTLVRIPVGFTAKSGKVYRMDDNGSTVTRLFRTTSASVYPYTISGVVSITRGTTVAVDYYYFYDWLISQYGCMTKRIADTAAITTTGLPKVKFMAGSACLGSATSFIDSSKASGTSKITNWSYAFGNGNTYSSGTTGNTTNTYAATGTYKAILTVAASNGCSDTFSRNIIEDSIPVASLSYSNTCLGSSTVFTGTTNKNIASYYIDFGDTSTSYSSTSSASTTHSYKYAGMHKVRYIVVSTHGCADSMIQTINLTTAPSSPTLSSTSSCGAGSVVLKASKPASGTYNFFYANSTTDTVLAKNDSFITPYLTGPKTYYVATAYLNSYYVGMKDNKTGTGAQVNNPALGLYFNALSTFILDSVTVYPGSTTGNIEIRLIDTITKKILDSVVVKSSVTAAGNPQRIGLGFLITKGGYALDAVGTTVTGLYRNQTNVAFPYTLNGIVSITAPYIKPNNARYYYYYNWRVSAISCSSSRVSVTANVGGAAKPKPKFMNTTACLGSATLFTDSSTAPSGGSLSSWNYDYGDGNSYKSTSSGSANHTYSKAGTYKVILTVGSGSCTDTISHTIIVRTAPSAKYSVSGACQGSATTFTDNSTGGATSYYYDFGDGNSDTAKNPVHTYTKLATYTIRHVASNGYCTDTLINTFTLNPIPKAKFSANGFCAGSSTIFTDSSTTGTGYFSKHTVDYGDGSPADTNFHPHYYNAGKFNVKLSVMTNNGCTASASDSVTIYTMPTATIGGSVSCRTVNLKATDSIYAGSSYSWDFGSSSATAKGQKVSYTYMNDSTYTISLTQMNGVCSTKHDTVITVICTGMEKFLSSDFNLTIFPNPFKDVTNISYSLSEGSKVHIQIYDMMGRSVGTLVNQRQEAGNYTMKFSPREYNADIAGMYILRMTIGDKIITRQILTVK